MVFSSFLFLPDTRPEVSIAVLLKPLPAGSPLSTAPHHWLQKLPKPGPLEYRRLSATGRPGRHQLHSENSLRSSHPHFHESPLSWVLLEQVTTSPWTLTGAWCLLLIALSRALPTGSLPLMTHSACTDGRLAELLTLSTSHLNEKIIRLKSVHCVGNSSSYPSWRQHLMRALA